MFVGITNTPRDYAWGSATAISELLGTTPSGHPEAELWLGAHPGSPSQILEPATVGGATDLARWITADPAATLGNLDHLPFLMKVLAAGSPLSLQAHPTAEQARDGFQRENAAKVPLDAPDRNYRDEFAKPEVIVALSDTFEALCGFRPQREAAAALSAVGLDELVPKLDDLPALFEWLMVGGPHIETLLRQLSANLAKCSGDSDTRNADHSTVARNAFDTARRLQEAYPGDPGILCSLLLNRVTLRKGQALYLPAGNIHAYLEGVGIEVMGASDNVLRGGLTPKHMDIRELLHVLDFTPGPPPWIHPDTTSPTVAMYRPGVDDFVLAHITGDAEIPITGPAIALCVSGAMSLDGATGSAELSQGQSVFITPTEQAVTVRGDGELFLATTP